MHAPPGPLARAKRFARRALFWRKGMCPYVNRFYLDLHRAVPTLVTVTRFITGPVELFLSTDKKYVFKTPNPKTAEPADVRGIQNEIRIMNRLTCVWHVPRLYRMPPVDPEGFPYTCGATTLVTEFVGYYSLDAHGRDAIAKGMVTADRLMGAALRALKFVHAEGIVHGDIHGGNFVFSNPRKVTSTLYLIDFERAQSYVSDDGRSHIEAPMEPPRYDKSYRASLLSPWELEGSHMARRDDLFRLAELGLELDGHAEFNVDWTAAGVPRECAEGSKEQRSSIPSCRAHIAILKRLRYIRSPSGSFREFYRATLNLGFSETVDYDGWIFYFNNGMFP